MFGKREVVSYSRLMGEERPFISVNLDLADPMELDDFVGFFAGMSSQFDRYMRAEHPDVAPEARFFVKDVRPGSTIVDIFTGGVGTIIQMMDGVLIVYAFSQLLGKLIETYSSGDKKEGATKAELKDLYDVVSLLAKDKDGRATIETVTWEKGALRRRVAFRFSNHEAQKAAEGIERHKAELDAIDRADRERVLMYFRRSDSANVPVGKRSGELVVIEEISEKGLALSYGSNLAEERIKDEIRNSLIYHRGFIVDVNIQTKGGRPVAYSVTHVHDVIDLPDDESD